MLVNEVNIFIPCCIDRYYPDTAQHLLDLFAHLGIKTNYFPEQMCCGKTLFQMGLWDDAKAAGEKFIGIFKNKKPIICPSASCVSFMKNYYRQLFEATSRLYLENKEIKNQIYELSDFLVNVLKIKSVGAKFPHRVSYHDSCSALREYPDTLTQEPRDLLNEVEGLELVEMDNRDQCCGFGGMFSVNFENISAKMTAEKVSLALETKAEYIVSVDYSCLMNMEAYINKNKLPIKCIHLVDVLNSR
ncbi:glycolate oxidase [Bacteroidia bacterium]|nr:glycolate oxidase [Bacteroidia bacterium]